MTAASQSLPLRRPLHLDSLPWAAAGTAAALLAVATAAVPDAWRAVSAGLRSAAGPGADTADVMARYVALALVPVALFSVAAVLAEEAGAAWLARRWPATAGRVVAQHESGAFLALLAMVFLTPMVGRWVTVPTTRHWPVIVDREGALTRGGDRVAWRDLAEVVRVESGGVVSSYVLFFRGGGQLIVNLGALVNVDEVCGPLTALGVLR